MNELTKTQSMFARIEAEISQQRREDHNSAWLLIAKLADKLMAETNRTGWIDATALIKLANRHRIHWGTYNGLDRMEWLLRNALSRNQTVMLDDVAVEITEMVRGKRSTPALKFVRTIPMNDCSKPIVVHINHEPATTQNGIATTAI